MYNISTPVSSALTGTKTLDNLKHVFEKEAQLFTKASIYSSIAGNTPAARAMKEQSTNTEHHAELWLGYLNELGDTAENLKELSSLNAVMADEIYPTAADIADDEGLREIAEKMRLMANVKKVHGKELEDEWEKVKKPDSIYATDPETIWHCTACGYNTKGNMPPERCPLCSYPAAFYART